MEGGNLDGRVQPDFDPLLGLLDDITCVPFAPPIHDCPSEMI